MRFIVLILCLYYLSTNQGYAQLPDKKNVDWNNYDLETKHGENIEVQSIWNKKINSELESLPPIADKTFELKIRK